MIEAVDSNMVQAPAIPDAEITPASLAATLGQTLASARQARGLSVADVAQAIKFSPRQIEAIESDDFDKLPGTAITRGFIRSYAKLLCLEPTSLLAMFDQQVPQVAATMQVAGDIGALLPVRGKRHSPLSPLLLVIGLLLLGAILAGLAFHYFAPESAQASPPVTAKTPLVAASPPAPTLNSADETAAALVTVAPAAVPSVSISLPDAPVTQPLTGVVAEQAGRNSLPDQMGANQVGTNDPELRQLVFVFDETSWVEVKDASRRAIFAQNNLAGTRQIVRGKPPFTLVIGKASHVQLYYDERPIDLAPYTKVDVARFNLE